MYDKTFAALAIYSMIGLVLLAAVLSGVAIGAWMF